MLGMYVTNIQNTQSSKFPPKGILAEGSTKGAGQYLGVKIV